MGEEVATSLEAIEKASQYSFENAAIGILIAFGDGNAEGVTPESIGGQFVKELQKRGVKARYFFYKADWEGMSMEYHIGHSALGPWSVNKAAKNITEAVEMLKAAKNVHGDWLTSSS